MILRESSGHTHTSELVLGSKFVDNVGGGVDLYRIMVERYVLVGQFKMADKYALSRGVVYLFPG